MQPPTPPGACDCHIHVYEDHRPLASTSTFKPPHAPLAAYREVLRALGLSRVLLVQPNGYGLDNDCLLEALAAMAEPGGPGGSGARAIATVPPDVSDAELQRLHRLGVCGVRYMLIAGAGGPLGWKSLPAMAERIAPLGWNINLQFDGRELPQRKALIDSLPCAVVIDHTGKFLEPVPSDDPAFKALLSMLEGERRWVKLSAPYETSKLGPPRYDDVAVLAKALLQAHPDRCLWASNWPHPNRDPVPSTAAMLALLHDWAGDDALSERVLVDNPARLYGFGR